MRSIFCVIYFFLFVHGQSAFSDEMPELEDAKNFFIMNDNFVVLPDEKVLVEKLRSKATGFQTIDMGLIDLLDVQRTVSVQFFKFEKDAKKKNSHFKEQVVVYVTPEVKDELYVELDKQTEPSKENFPESLKLVDGFSYLGSKFVFKSESTTFSFTLRNDSYLSKKYPEFSEFKNTLSAEIKSHRIYYRRGPESDRFLIKTKDGKEYVFTGKADVSGKIYVTDWLEGYLSFRITDGKCDRLIFINEQDVFQVKLPCRLLVVNSRTGLHK